MLPLLASRCRRVHKRKTIEREMRTNTIKAFVEDAAREGHSATEIWRAAESKWPGRHISWNYIIGLRRRYIERAEVALAEEFKVPRLHRVR